MERLVCIEERPGGSWAGSIVTGARLLGVLLGPLLLAACEGVTGAGDAGQGSLRGRSLLLITLDTARQDHFGCYGTPGMEGTTPEIDRLAAEGALFLNAYSETNVTNPSHASIFTGLYSIDHIMNNRTRFSRKSKGADTLAEAFLRAGYHTASFPAAHHVSAEGLALPGFQYTTPPAVELKAAQVVDSFLAWVDRSSGKPFFAWVHLFDPHVPYRPPGAYQRLYYRGDPKSGSEPPLREEEGFELSPDLVQTQFSRVRDRSYPPAMYRAEIHYTDKQVGRMLRGLERRGLWDETAVILLGDHGESLGEHGVYYDHQGLYDTTLRIPFVVRVPGYPNGVRVEAPVVQIDLAPTLNELFELDLASAQSLPGVSLVDALRGASNPLASNREWMIHESAHNQFVAVRSGSWKAIFRIWGRKRPWPAVQLFHLGNDPKEENDLAEQHPERVEEMRERAQAWIEAGPWISKKGVAKKWLDALQALGYIEEEPVSPSE